MITSIHQLDYKKKYTYFRLTLNIELRNYLTKTSNDFVI